MARSTNKIVQIAPASDDFDLPYILPTGTQEPQILQVAVVGRSPLLCHSAFGMLSPKNTRGNSIPTPEEEAAAGAYMTERGEHAIPGVAFQRSLVEAASIFKAPRGRGSIQSHMAGVEVVEDMLPLIDPVTRQPLTAYAIDKRTAIIQRARIVRCRPRYDRWAIGRITFRYDPALVEPAIILRVLADAGVRRGVGDFRPGKSKGGFGRFAIVGVRMSRDLPWEAYQPNGAADIERVEEPDEEDAAQ